MKLGIRYHNSRPRNARSNWVTIAVTLGCLTTSTPAWSFPHQLSLGEDFLFPFDQTTSSNPPAPVAFFIDSTWTNAENKCYLVTIAFNIKEDDVFRDDVISVTGETFVLDKNIVTTHHVRIKKVLTVKTMKSTKGLFEGARLEWIHSDYGVSDIEETTCPSAPLAAPAVRRRSTFDPNDPCADVSGTCQVTNEDSIAELDLFTSGGNEGLEACVSGIEIPCEVHSVPSLPPGALGLLAATLAALGARAARIDRRG